jgi:hypothetical protein
MAPCMNEMHEMQRDIFRAVGVLMASLDAFGGKAGAVQLLVSGNVRISEKKWRISELSLRKMVIV